MKSVSVVVAAVDDAAIVAEEVAVAVAFAVNLNEVDVENIADVIGVVDVAGVAGEDDAPAVEP